MFTNLEQHSRIKIEVTRSRSTQEFLRDCVKHVAMQRCHIAQCHDGLMRSGKAGVPFKTIPRGDDTFQLLASLLNADCRCTAWELVADVGVSHKTVLHILYDILCYRKLAARWIPYEISEVQQWHRYAVAQALFDRYQREGDDFLQRIIAISKPGLANTNQPNERKHPGSSRPKKMHPTHISVKMMFIVAYHINGVLLHLAVPPKQTVNAAYYCTFLQPHLRPAIRRKLRHLVVQNPIILHDNARNHTAGAVMDLLRRRQWEILEHPQYSHDVSQCDYGLFAKVKEPLRGTLFYIRDELIRTLGLSIRNLSKDGRADDGRRLPNIC